MNFRRIFSLFLAVLMTFSTFAEIIPANVFASEIVEQAETLETTEKTSTEPKVIANYTIPANQVIVNEDGSLTINLPETLPGETTAVETEPVVTEPVVTEPVVTEPVVTEPVVTEPVVTEPVVTEPVVTEPVVTEPVVTEPVVTEPVVTEPVVTEPVVTEPVVTEPVVTEPVVTEPTETEPTETEPTETEPTETEPEETEPEVIDPLTWFQWIGEKDVDTSALTKEESSALREEYSAYRLNFLAEMGEPAEGAAYQKVSNDYIEVVVGTNGRFTIGNKKGNPAWDSDDNQILLYGHPNPSTSETLIRIDGQDYNYFYADNSSKSGDTITSTMNISSYGIKVVQTLKLIKVGSNEFADTVQIQYQVYNNSNKSHDVGIRIMMDTMLADNDWATFHTSESITSAKVYEGQDAIPGMYQVYDKTTNPTTLATGYLYRGSDRVPDKVQFCNWPGIVSSGWDHVVRDGDELGDSAVGIYFNPTTIAANSNTSVRTYYGVSVGSASGSSTTMSSKKVKLIVRDSYTKEPLEGAKITCKIDDSTRSYTTDINGIAILEGFSVSKAVSRERTACTLSISKDGYKRYSENRRFLGGSTQTVELATSSTERPVVHSVTLTENGNKTDLLSESMAFVVDTNNRIGKDGATGSVSISATSDMSDCIWKLFVGDKEIVSSKNGTFTLKTRTADYGTFIEKMSEGNNVYIQAISSKGVKSEKVRIGLTIRPNHKIDLPILDIFTLLPGGKAPLYKESFAALFLGQEFKFGPEKNDFLEFQVKLKDDGSFVVGVNVTNNFLDTLNNKVTDAKGQITDQTRKELVKALQEEMKSALKDKNGTGPKLSRFGFGQKKVDFIFSGFGAGNVVNGEAKFTLNVAISLSGSVSYKTQFIVASVPCFINVGGTLAGKLEGEGQVTKDNVELTKGEFTPSFSINLQGGMGVQGVTALYADGTATASLICDILNKHQTAKISGKADLVLEVFIWSKSLPVAEAEAIIYDSQRANGTVYGGEESIYAMLEAEPFHLVTREEMNGESADGGTSGGATKVQLLHVGSDLYKFFLEDRGGNQSNRFMLSYSKLVDGSWTEATPVADDGTLDTYFDVATDGSNIYVVWSNSTKLFDDSTVTVDEMFGCQEICYTTISADGTIATPLQITSNSAMDVLPVITTIGGNTYLAWYYTENGLETNTDAGDYYLKYTCVQAGTPGEISSVSFSKSAISSITASSASGLPLATVVSNASTVDAFTDDTTTVIDMSNGELNNLNTTGKTLGKSVTGTIDGAEMVFWMENGNVAYADAITSENPTYIFTEDTLPGTISTDNYTVITVSGSTYLIWTESGLEEGDPAIAMTTVYTDGAWSAVHKLTDLSNGNICELDGYLNSDGKLVLVYTAKTISTDANGTITQQTVSLEKTVEPEKTVRIDRVDFAVTDAIPGEALPITVALTNTGNTAIESLDLQINSDAGENYTSTLTGLSIAPGTDTEVEITDFVLSSQLTTKNNNEDPYVYTVTAKASDSEITAQETFEIGHSRVALYKEDVYYMDNREHVVLALENRSGFPVENVQVQILEGSTEGVLVYHNTFEELTANDHYAITLDVEDITSNSLFAFISTGCDAGEEPECVELMLSTGTTMANLTVESIGCGTTTPAGDAMYTFGESVEIQAIAQEGYLFDGWYSNRTLTYLAGNEDMAKAQIVMPNGDTTVTARFVSETPYDFTLNADSADLFAGDSFQLEAIFASPEQTGKVIWSSSDESVATVNRRGVVDCLAAGTTTITAACGDYIHSCEITVSYVDVTEILMVYPVLNLAMGESTQAEALTEPENGTGSLKWTSSDETVATVDRKGNVTAVGYGTAVITAASFLNETVTAECTVNVIVPVEEIYLDHQILDLTLTDNLAQLNVTYGPENADYGKNITWHVEDSGILELTPSGEFNETLDIKAVNRGITTITARTEEGIEASCTVNVQDIVYASSVEELQSEHPYAANLDRTWIYTDETKDFMVLRFSQDSDVSYPDILEVMDSDGNIAFNSEYEGYVGGSLVFVEDSTVQIRLSSQEDSTGSYGFRVEEISDTILPEDISIYTYDQTYTGKALQPDFSVTYGNRDLYRDEEYTLRYSNNKNVGEATVTFIGKGLFEGITTSATFKILPNHTKLDATVTKDGIKLTWAAAKGAGNYLLYRNVDDEYDSETGDRTWIQLAKLSASAKSYTDKDTNSEHFYCYKLVPYKDVTKNKVTTRYEAGYATHGPITKLGPVTNLTAVEDPDTHAITLSWDALDGADGYFIQRSRNSDYFTQIDATENTTITLDEELRTGRTQYAIAPYKYIDDYQRKGVLSNIISFYRLDAPELQCYRENNGVKIYCNHDYYAGQTGLEVYRSTNGGTSWKKWKTIKDISSYDLYDTGAKSETTTYQYKARLFVKDGKQTHYSDWSNICTALATPSISSVKTAENGGLSISWKKVPGAEWYTIFQYYEGENGEWDRQEFTYQVEDPEETIHVFLDDSAIQPGQYGYQILAHARNPLYEEEPYESQYSDGKDAFILSAPEIYGARNQTKGTQLNWSGNRHAQGYEVWRSTDYNAETGEGKFSKVATLKNGYTYLNDTKATKNATTYTYQVRAYSKVSGSTFYSDFSAPMSVSKMTPPKLKNLTVRDDGGFDITFTSVSDADGYEIIRFHGEGRYTEDSVSLANFPVTDENRDQKTFTIQDPGATDKNMVYQYLIHAYRDEGTPTYAIASVNAYGYHFGQPEVSVENTEKGTMIYASVSDALNSEYGYASYYTIYRSENNGISYKTLKTVKADSNGFLAYNDTSAKAGKTYLYKVMASGKKAFNAFTAEVSQPTAPILCKPGPKLSSLTSAIGGFTVSWKTQKNMPAAKEYIIYRSQDNFHYEQIATVDSNTFTYTDTSIDIQSSNYFYIDDYMFYYKVAAVPEDPGMPVTYSKPQSSLYMFAPYDVSAWNHSDSSAYVNWHCDGFWSGYEIRYKTGSTTKTVKNKNMLTGLKMDKTYEISVRTYLKYNGKTYYSAWSNPYELIR